MMSLSLLFHGLVLLGQNTVRGEYNICTSTIHIAHSNETERNSLERILSLYNGGIAGCPLPCTTYQTETRFLQKDPTQYPHQFGLTFDSTVKVPGQHIFLVLENLLLVEGDQYCDDEANDVQPFVSGKYLHKV